MEPSPGDRTLRLAGFPLILLIYGWVYSFRLTLYPLFIDEAIHIRWARDTLMLSPFAPFDEGKLLMWAALTPFFPFDNGVFTARMVIVLVGMLGLAAAMALGTRLWGARAGLTAGLLLTLMPLGVFFGRMALPDPLGMSLLLVAAALTVEALHSGRALPAFAAGVALALAAFTRLTMMVYLVVPVVGWVLIKRSNVQIARIYAAVLLTALPFLVGGVLAGSIGLEHASGFVEPAPVLQRAGQHIRRAWRWLSVYATVPLLVISPVSYTHL
ncbi:MAG: hypothetical protein GYB64_07815, partial [Chloroflexi bacterium]|nr:hypothetical protein [Chloroflexota bacterium]